MRAIHENYAFAIALAVFTLIACIGWFADDRDAIVIGLAMSIGAAQFWLACCLMRCIGPAGFIAGLVLFKATLFTGIFLTQ